MKHKSDKKKGLTSDGEMYHYILVASDVGRNCRFLPSGMDVAMHRLNLGMWGLNSRTANRRGIKSGEKALVYISGGGPYSQHLVASCTFVSDAKLSTWDIRQDVDAPNKKGYMMPEYYVRLNDVEIFKRPLPMVDLVSNLNFIKDKEDWWRYLQGGVRKISQSDYQHVSDTAKLG